MKLNSAHNSGTDSRKSTYGNNFYRDIKAALNESQRHDAKAQHSKSNTIQ